MIGIALMFMLVIIGLLLYIDARKPYNFPPGPKWLPILGAAIELTGLRRRSGYLTDAVKELSKIYGPIVGIRVGKDRQVVLNGYEAVREMLSRDEFDGKPKGLFYETRTWGKRRGLLLVDDSFWIEQRRFVLRHLREFGYGKSTMSDLVTEEAEFMVKDFKERLAKNGSKPTIMEMRDTFGLYTINTLWKMLAGYRYSSDDAELLTLQSLLTALLARVDMVGAPFSQFPILRYIAPEKSGYNYFVEIHDRIGSFLQIELERHKAAFDPHNLRDFMDVYLKMLSEPDLKPSFSEEQLLAICLDMFIAGSETTSKSLGFCFLYLVRNQEVQKKAQNEIDQVIGRSRLPELSDRPSLPYCDAVGLEGIRMFMARNFGIPHRALKDTTLMGYNIPKETMLVPNISSVLMDKTVWGDPEEFRPDRFIDENGKVFIPDQYLPFGFGKHRCMGETLARSNLFILTTSLLQNFTFTVPPGELPPTLEYMDGVTASTYPYNALVTPRP